MIQTSNDRFLPNPTLRISRDLLPTQVGTLTAPGEPVQVGRATRLRSLPDDAGMVLLARDGTPAVVESLGDGDLLRLHRFSEPAPEVWDVLEALWPGTRPGQDFARLVVAWEPLRQSYSGCYGVLDLEHLDMLGWASGPQVERLCAEANAAPNEVLRRLAIEEVSQILRTADPRVAGALAERIWRRWERSMGEPL